MLAVVAFLAVVLGLVGLFRPLQSLGIRSRQSAAWVLAVGLLALLLSGRHAPVEEPTLPPPESSARDTSQDPDDEIARAGDEIEQVSETPTAEGAQHTPEPKPSPVEVAEEPTSPAGVREEDKGLRSGITQVIVTKVVDGDTIDVEYLDGEELPASRVRLIGVDTPEIHGQNEAYGTEASAFTKVQLTGKTVWLERDVSETDRYGRALRYVWLTEPPLEPTEDEIRQSMFNAILVLGGYAQASTYPPDVKYADLLASLQAEVREPGKGLWGIAETPPAAAEPESGQNAGAGEPPATGQAQNCDPAYPDVCIPPPPPDLDCGDISHRRFRVLPPDPHRFDGRDQDGIGCET